MTNIDEVVEGRLSKIVEEVCDFDFEGKLFTDIGFEEFKTHIKQALQTIERETREDCKKVIPKEKPMGVFSFVLKGEELEQYMRHKGYNECRDKIIEALTPPITSNNK